MSDHIYKKYLLF